MKKQPFSEAMHSAFQDTLNESEDERAARLTMQDYSAAVRAVELSRCREARILFRRVASLTEPEPPSQNDTTKTQAGLHQVTPLNQGEAPEGASPGRDA